MALTPKKLQFKDEYLIDLNATQAAIRSGYSVKTAYSQGQRLLKDAEIQRLIQEAMQERSEKVNLTAENVLQSIITIRSKAIEADKLNDALKANELLGRHLKLFTDKTEITGKDGAPLDLTVNFVKPQ